jgi:integrase
VAATGKGGTLVIDDKPTTLRAALDQYEADLKTRAGDVGNAARVRRHLSEKMLDKLIVDLMLNDLRKWRDQLTSKARQKNFCGADKVAMPTGLTEKTQGVPPIPLAPSGVNRVCTIMKAALNLAADRDERITSRRPWEQGLATLPDAEESRNVILSNSQVRMLVDHSQTQGAEFGLLVEGLASTGARISQLARVNVGDMQDGRPDPRIMMPSSRKGNGRKTVLRRPVPISIGFAQRLRNASEGKQADAPLFAKATGERWSKSDHSRLFARVVNTAEVGVDEDAPITISALRHSSIVRQLLANVPVRVVAALHDTSVAMIERTYSRYIVDHTDAMARASMFSAS